MEVSLDLNKEVLYLTFNFFAYKYSNIRLKIKVNFIACLNVFQVKIEHI